MPQDPPADDDSDWPPRLSRRFFMQSAGGAAAAAGTVGAGCAVGHPGGPGAAEESAPRSLRLQVNGRERSLTVTPATTLLDALRDQLGLVGSKKGCDRGQCGACTVLADGRRINACLALAVMQDGVAITTVEGLGSADALHPVQAAFIQQDAFQCGYCTPGQICSVVAMLAEARSGAPSAVTADVKAPMAALTLWSDDEIRERLSGNICRCGAYPHIVAAVRQVAGGGAA